MVTELGKYLRRLRLDEGELLKEMAVKLDLASSSLSSIESGRRKPPKGFAEKIASIYTLTSDQVESLQQAMAYSADEVALVLKGMSASDRELAVAFARRFENLDEADKRRIKEVLGEAD